MKNKQIRTVAQQLTKPLTMEQTIIRQFQPVKQAFLPVY